MATQARGAMAPPPPLNACATAPHVNFDLTKVSSYDTQLKYSLGGRLPILDKTCSPGPKYSALDPNKHKFPNPPTARVNSKPEIKEKERSGAGPGSYQVNGKVFEATVDAPPKYSLYGRPVAKGLSKTFPVPFATHDPMTPAQRDPGVGYSLGGKVVQRPFKERRLSGNKNSYPDPSRAGEERSHLLTVRSYSRLSKENILPHSSTCITRVRVGLSIYGTM